MSDFDLDDEFDALDDEILIQAAAQAEAAQFQNNAQEFTASPRPAKRRKLSHDEQNGINTRIGPSEDQIGLDSSDVDYDAEHITGGYSNLIVNETARTEEPYDYAKDLEDLPSDAFRTSSPPPESEAHGVTAWNTVSRAPLQNLRQTTLFGRAGSNGTTIQKPAAPRRNWPMVNKTEPPTHHELDLEAAKLWIYPTNLGKIRDYQFNIVQRGLFHNTLVALPTGLGKTLIAATIMLNWFRWTKNAKIVFVAPTKPLVAQQIHACAQITGIPYSECVVLTGEVHKTVRQDEWESKRLFFMTPQTLQSDLSSGIADAKKIVLLVVDEAHRAKGQYAYVQVVKRIGQLNQSVRILALTATPGADVKAVQEVIDGLDISRVEIRTDQSLDLREYVHDRDVETQVFKISDDMATIMELYSKAVKPLMDAIDAQLPGWMKDPISLTPYGCNQAMLEWGKSGAGRSAPGYLKGRVVTVFNLLAGLTHGMDLLKYHSLNAAYHKWKEFKDQHTSNPQSKSAWKDKLFTNAHFRDMMDKLERWNRNPDFIGHPKLAYLRAVILNHLLDRAESHRSDDTTGSRGTRIMVFTSFRDSAEVVVQVLRRTDPLIKPHVFVGQADSKNSKGMTQKRQLEVIEQFKEGKYNTLIATSIGEEGLDIGEVDLIVCYDSKSSPLRMLQRMGRTGRKRAGKVVLLQMEGKEENDWQKAKDSYQTMQRKIADGNEFTFHEDRSRRILPQEIVPVVDKRHIEIPVENSQVSTNELPALPKRGKRKVKKKFQMPDGVETGFVNAGSLNGTAKRRNSKKAPAALEEEESEQVPYIGSVSLTADQTITLQQGYQYQHFDDDEESAQLSRPALDKFPVDQRSLRFTKFVPHGRTTQLFVHAMQNIAAMDDYTVAEYELGVDKSLLEDGPDISRVLSSGDDPPRLPSISTEPALSLRSSKPTSKPKAAPRARKASTTRVRALPAKHSFEAEVGASSSPPPSDPAYAMRSQAISLGSQDTEPDTNHQPGVFVDSEDDSELDSFVVPDDEVIAEMEEREAREEIESSLPSILALRDDADHRGRGVFPMSTANAADSSSLPDYDELMKRRMPLKRVQEKDLRAKKRRRVIESDDGDDNDSE
jgi:ATP-dependent DNA helicase MPH1